MPKTIYEARPNRESGPIGFFECRDDAEKAAKHRDDWGGDGVVIPRTLHESYESFDQSRKIDLIESAKKKLTADEREALGLSPLG